MYTNTYTRTAHKANTHARARGRAHTHTHKHTNTHTRHKWKCADKAAAQREADFETHFLFKVSCVLRGACAVPLSTVR